MADPTVFVSVGISATVSAITAVVTVLITYYLSKKREHEADWRKLKFNQYQEYILALSGCVRERATPDAHRRYADAVNSMALVGTADVLSALRSFQDEISFKNTGRSEDRHDRLLDLLLRAMRKDIHPVDPKVDPTYSFRLLGLPPDVTIV